jgi:hypothetical protein
VANSATHRALPYPIKGARFSLPIPYLDADGDPTDPTTPDTEVSKDAGAFADCTEEVTTVTGSNGVGYITLTGAETDCSMLVVCAKVASGPKATLLECSPAVLAEVGTGTLSAGSAGGGTLGTLLAYDVTGCFIKTTGGTGGGGTGGASNQARKIVTYNTGTGAFTVTPNWETTPDNTTTYAVLLPEGVTLGMLRALNPTTAGRTLDVTATGAAGVDWGNVENPTTTVGLSGTTVKTATDVETDTADIQSRLPAALGANGNIKADVRDWLGTAAATPTTAGVPEVDVTHFGGAAGTFLSGRPEVKLGDVAHGGTSAVITFERMVGASATLNEPCVKFTGNGSGDGINLTGGQTGDGLHALGGLSGGYGIHALSQGIGGSGLYAQGSGAGGSGATFNGDNSDLTLTNSASATLADAVWLSGSTRQLTGTQAFNLTGDITGNLSGSVGSVAAGGITSASIATGAVDADALATDAVEEIRNAVTGGAYSLQTDATGYVKVSDGIGTGQLSLTAGFLDWNASWDAEVQSEVADGLTAYGASTVTTAQVNAEMVDALSTDTYAEPGQGAPGATLSLAAKINYLYATWRNKKTQTATEFTLFADDGTTAIAKSTVSDDGTTSTFGEMVTGA